MIPIAYLQWARFGRLLSGLHIGSEADVGAVMAWFHNKGVKTVVLSSTDLGNAKELICMASTKNTGQYHGLLRLFVIYQFLNMNILQE